MKAAPSVVSSTENPQSSASAFGVRCIPRGGGFASGLNRQLRLHFAPQEPRCLRLRFHMVRILIADDYEAARRAIRRLLEQRPGWEVCGEAADGRGGVLNTAELKPDVVILDLALGMIDGLAAPREMSRLVPGVPLVLCTVVF